MKSAIIRKHTAGSFSFGYSGETDSGFNQISLGFSDNHKKFFWGGVFDFLFIDAAPQVTIDIGASYEHTERLYSSIAFLNIFETDKSFSRLARTVDYSIAGQPLSTVRLYFLLDIFARIYTISAGKLGYGFDAMIQKDFFKNPFFNLYARCLFESDKNKEIGVAAEFGTGIFAYFSKTLAGISVGYRYPVESSSDKIFLSLYINPSHGDDDTPPTAVLDFSRAAFTPDGDGIHDNILISISCADNKDGTGLKKWSIVITSNQDDSKGIVRMYAGASLPPETIQWEGRDSQGNLCEPGAYFIQFTASDNNNNITKTPWKKVILKKLF
ncbi:MAG: hypothetical protein GF350_11720 [Chitinivibrionales bacterium]|nr:hypothetical protein [Chitinivibrionales bacterium]